MYTVFSRASNNKKTFRKKFASHLYFCETLSPTRQNKQSIQYFLYSQPLFSKASDHMSYIKMSVSDRLKVACCSKTKYIGYYFFRDTNMLFSKNAGWFDSINISKEDLQLIQNVNQRNSSAFCSGNLLGQKRQKLHKRIIILDTQTFFNTTS